MSFVTDVTEVAEGNTNLQPPRDKPSRSWCFTLNNYTEADVQRCRDWESKYIVFGKEIGASGTPHLQGFITWKKPMRLSAVRKLCGRAHWEIARSEDAAANYCMKENYEIIDKRTQGSRTDLENAIDLIKQKGLKKMKEDFPKEYIRYHNGMEKFALSLQKPRDFKPVVKWIHGPTGTGKTRSVVDIENDLWISSSDLRWWDGYENQEAVLFDDFRADMCRFRWLLRLLDRYPCKVEVKGGFREFNSKRIYITSCKHPNDVYDNTKFDHDEKVDQLLRRLDDIIYMS